MSRFLVFISLILLSNVLMPSLASARMVVTDDGTEAASNAVQCGSDDGTVTVSTGAEWEWIQIQEFVNEEGEVVRTEEKVIRKGDDAIYIRYTGDNADSFKWIQFVRVIYRVNFPNDPFFELIPLTITFSTGDVDTTTDMRHPQWHIDSSSDTDPTMDSHVQVDNSGGYVDQPSDPISPPEADWFSEQKGVTSGEVQYYYEAYLIHNGRICYKVAWEKVQRWDRSTNPQLSPPQTSLVSAGPANSADAAQRGALARHYPNQTAVNPFPP